MTVSTLKYLFLALFLSFVTSQCPDGTYAYPAKSECILPLDAVGDYGTAKKVCKFTDGGRLIQIGDSAENDYTWAMAGIVFGADWNAYIGIIHEPEGVWTYGDGTPLTYENWFGGSDPDNGTCVVLDGGRYKKWVAVSCMDPYRIICSFPMKRDSSVLDEVKLPIN